MKNAILLVMAVILTLAANVQADIIWSDGFESGDFSAWTSASFDWDTSGGNTHSGSKRGQIAGPFTSGEEILLLQYSTATYEDVALEYWHRIYAGLEENDYVFVEWTADGIDWQEIVTYNDVAHDADWQQASYLLPADADDNPLFGLRIRSGLNHTSDCIYFDDLALSAAPIPEPASTILFLSCLAYFTADMFRKKS